MRTIRQIDDFLQQVVRWASAQPDVKALALVGSYGRSAATENSDIDLILITDDPDRYLKNAEWVKRFGSVVKQQREDYGKVISVRVWYANGYEVEYGITTPEWARPRLDEGTRNVIKDGIKILFERSGLFKKIPLVCPNEQCTIDLSPRDSDENRD